MELYRYTKQEDLANSLIHFVGFTCGFAVLAYLSYISEDIVELISVLIYSLTLMFMFLSSAVYHIITIDKVRIICKKLDHSAIFLLITGTYIPYTFIALNTTMSYFVVFILTILSIAGIILKFHYAGRYKKISTLIYVLMGWFAFFEGHALFTSLPTLSFCLLVAGGIMFSIGALFYALCNFKYHHFIWHIFVLVAAYLHVTSIIVLLLNS